MQSLELIYILSEKYQQLGHLIMHWELDNM